MVLYQQRSAPFPPEPLVVPTAETGRRASQLLGSPGVQRLARGLWVLRDEPLTAVERAVLLQRHLCRPESGLLVSGLHGLELLRLPVGGSEAWVQDVLARPRQSRGQRQGVFSASSLNAANHCVELLWTGHRAQSKQEGVRIAMSHGLPSLVGPWGSRVAHPLEMLSRMSTVLSPWRITACLDALLSTRFIIPGTSRPVQFTRDQLEESLDQLPPTARGVIRLRRAWRDARSPCWSAAETLTRLIIARHDLPEPSLNHQVTIAGRTFFLDLAWPGARTAVEYNGGVHAREVSQYRDEMYRLSLLRDAGWDVSVLTWDDLRSPTRRMTWLSRVQRGLGRPHRAL